MHGKGVYHFSHGLIYEGEFCRDKKHGYGKITTEHGHSYEGIWEEDWCKELSGWKSFPSKNLSPDISETRLESKMHKTVVETTCNSSLDLQSF